MIKINHANIYQVCQDYTDFVLKKNRHLNKGNQYIAYVFSEHNFKDIVSCPASNLHNKIELFHKLFPDRDPGASARPAAPRPVPGYPAGGIPPPDKKASDRR